MKITSIDIIIPVFKPGKTLSDCLSMLKGQTVPFDKLIVLITDPESEESDTESAVSVRRKSIAKGAIPVTKKITLRATIPAPGKNSSKNAMSPDVEESLEDTVKEAFKDEPERLIIRHIKEKDFDHAGTRCLGVRLSDADAFICMTDDAVPADKYLIERLKEALERDERIALAYARQLATPQAREAEKYTRVFNYPDHSLIKSKQDLDKYGIKTYFASNVCCAYRRDIYEKIGGFEAPAIFNEDMIYAARAIKSGYLAYYKSDAMVIHSHDYTPMQNLRRSFDQGLSQAMHPEVFEGIKTETEGVRYVKDTARHLMKKGMPLGALDFIYNAFIKYIGFKLGTYYKKLPEKLVYKLAQNKTFVRNNILRRK